MSSVAKETAQVLAVMERVETLEGVVNSFSPDDERREKLLAVVASELKGAPPVRPVIAAQIVNLSERTVRNWAAHGLLTVWSRPGSGKTARLLLDFERLHLVKSLLNEARASAQPGPLIDQVYRRLVDSTWVTRDDLRQSLREMPAEQGVVRVPKPVA